MEGIWIYYLSGSSYPHRSYWHLFVNLIEHPRLASNQVVFFYLRSPEPFLILCLHLPVSPLVFFNQLYLFVTPLAIFQFTTSSPALLFITTKWVLVAFSILLNVCFIPLLYLCSIYLAIQTMEQLSLCFLEFLLFDYLTLLCMVWFSLLQFTISLHHPPQIHSFLLILPFFLIFPSNFPL